MFNPKLKDLDDYSTAAEYAIEQALISGNGKLLRAIKTLIDEVSSPTIAEADALKKHDLHGP